MADRHPTPADIPEVYALESVEQLRALADELRVRIFAALAQRPLTATQLGEELGIAAPKAHYHVRELERVGLVRLVETRERGGILEKYFRAVARDIQVSHALLRRTPDETLAVIRDQLQSIERGFAAAFARALAVGDPGGGYTHLSTAALWATKDEMRDLARKIDELVVPYLAPRAGEGVRQRMLVTISYDAGIEEHATPPEHELAGARRAPNVRRVSVAGVISYARRDFERVVAAGEALDLRVVGVCIIADDVTPELADRAVARLRLRGTLSAPDAVRAVLENKQPPQQRKEL